MNGAPALAHRAVPDGVYVSVRLAPRPPEATPSSQNDPPPIAAS